MRYFPTCRAGKVKTNTPKSEKEHKKKPITGQVFSLRIKITKLGVQRKESNLFQEVPKMNILQNQLTILLKNHFLNAQTELIMN
jgi:hypothetical protein